MGGRQAVLESRHMDQAGLQVDLIPAQRHELGDPEAMPVGNQNKRPIARAVTADLAGGLQEPLDLLGLNSNKESIRKCGVTNPDDRQ